MLSKPILKDFASEDSDAVDETDIVDIWIDEYIKSGKDKDGLKYIDINRPQAMTGIGSPELYTAVVVPLVVEFVKVIVIPLIKKWLEKREKDDLKLVETNIKREIDKICDLINHKNRKKARKILEQLSRDTLDKYKKLD